MRDVVIRATDLKKVYRLYRKPSYRFLDMFGLLGARPNAYTEHAALDGVTLEIAKREKVAIIGRNGAGKSTLLKLVTRVIEPTAGTLEVKGKVHALLQIGTGFHPDFTGRENVYAYFAQLGISGKEADRKCAEVIEFAELEEYIDQPMKTYSTGMGVRLMFSASTAITPDLLVLDEVLGVGDAYFAQKSYERIRELCEREGTTLLLVTHDIYSAVKLCDRVVWMDRGRILLDGSGPVVVKAYEDSIRLQEENRLRLKKQQRVIQLLSEAAAAGIPPLVFEVRSPDNRPPAAPVFFSRIELQAAADRFELPLGADAFDERLQSHLQREATSWGESLEWHGRTARPFLNYGSPFHKVAGVFTGVPSGSADLSVSIDYWCEKPFDMVARGFSGNREISFGRFQGVPGEWHSWTGNLEGRSDSARPGGTAAGVHGTGAISLTDIRTLDGEGRETQQFFHGRPFQLVVSYRINQPRLLEKPQILVAFHRDGVQDVCRIITRDLLFDSSAGTKGDVRVRLANLPLANGTYAVTVMVAREAYYDQLQTVYFSLNPGVYACHTRAFDIVVAGGGTVATGTTVVIDGEWTLEVLCDVVSQEARQG